jgi:CubicO group peptidase (beta-lactamase class C family)
MLRIAPLAVILVLARGDARLLGQNQSSSAGRSKPAGRSTAPDFKPPETWQRTVDAEISPLIEKKQLMGVVVGIFAPDGKREFHCYGQATTSGPPPNPKSVFEIGSISKVFTALLLADMVSRGELKYEDPVQNHLPRELVVPRRGRRQITLLELATHTSGLPEFPANMPDEDPFAKYGMKQLAEGLAEIKLKDVDRPKVRYSSLGMGLLGEALAHANKTSFTDLLRTRITKPLGTNDTTVTLAHVPTGRIAIGFDGAMRPVPSWHFATLQGAGAVCSTASDLLTFLEAESGRTETQLSHAMRMTQEKRQPAFWIMNVGLGWFMRERNGVTAWWHNGGTGGYESYAAFCRKPAVGLVLLSNMDCYANAEAITRIGQRLTWQLIESAAAHPAK